MIRTAFLSVTFATILAAVSFLAPANAQAWEAADCTNPMTQSAMNICAAREYEQADAALNAVWPRVRAHFRRLDEEERPSDGQPGHWETLLEAQRAWLGYRDAHCLLSSYDARGGSLQPLLRSNCLADLTRARTEQLEALLVNQVSGEPAAEAGE